MSSNIEQTFQAGSVEDLQTPVETFDENEIILDNVSESHSASEDIECSPYLEWTLSWSEYIEEILAEKERDLALENGDSSEDFSWPPSDESWVKQPIVTIADEEAQMAALDEEAENALNTGAKRSPDAPAPVVFIDTLEKLDKFLPVLSRLKDGVELAFDCEGTPEEDENGKPIPGGGFGRTGDMSFLSMTVISIDITYVFDVWQLKSAVFDRQNNDGLSLKKILESHDRIQLWWDVRSDWDTLFHKFGIQIGKVRDVQLIELLSRWNPKSNVFGLYKVMRWEGHHTMSNHNWNVWLKEKTEGGAYFQNNGWRPLTTRPLTRTAKNYISGDTECLYGLHKRLQDRLEEWLYILQGKTVGGLMDAIGKPSTLPATMDDLMQFIDEQSMIRAQDATSPGFDSRSREGKADAPAAFLRITDVWENSRDRGSKRREEGQKLVQSRQSMAVDS
ncbi:uncharacterized protein EAE98_005831 [Botrytis deweyae]|uniref:3'-5' exonuclease domain-containing protein n=1 Tax=Botrytis deweyae TaxID=2478750 RepID=A0ABQ7IMX1_9HELO|nr:uncharacterized protein EAE98_005831 [Botrytis deweyae]KAF7928775.1 hypothetical protein EAE98_005831 [Botrytis deweyae]